MRAAAALYSSALMATQETVIAVLDDETEMRRALRRLLTQHGYLVEEYARGRELLAVLDSHRIDCLLLDLHMPEVSGFDVLEDFRSRHVTVPVIVITAHDEHGTAERVRSLGGAAYLKKPIERDVLLFAIRKAIHSNTCCATSKD